MESLQVMERFYKVQRRSFVSRLETNGAFAPCYRGGLSSSWYTSQKTDQVDDGEKKAYG